MNKKYPRAIRDISLIGSAGNFRRSDSSAPSDSSNYGAGGTNNFVDGVQRIFSTRNELADLPPLPPGV